MNYKHKYIKYKTKYFNQRGGNNNSIKAICNISSNDNSTFNKVNGIIYLDEVEDGTRIYGYIDNLIPGLHGFHIHESGDLTKCCDSLKGHYNPFEKTHSSRVIIDPNTGKTKINTNRHVGDLGNIIANDNGRAEIDFVDPLVKLRDSTSVIGRSIIVHADKDDLGLGGTEESLKTGTAGKRIGCGVIGLR